MSDSIDLSMIRSYLKYKYGLREQQQENLITVAANSIKDSLDAAEEALTQSDWVALSESAHKLKGTLLIISLSYWAEKADKIHSAAEQKKVFDYRNELRDIREGLKELCDMAGTNTF